MVKVKIDSRNISQLRDELDYMENVDENFSMVEIDFSEEIGIAWGYESEYCASDSDEVEFA